MEDRQHNPADDARRFLEALYPEVPAGLHILIWSLREKHSHWASSAADAAAKAVSAGADRDVYVGVGLSPQALGPDRRCKAEDVAAIAGFWADLDVAGDGHKKSRKKLIPSFEDAQKLLAELPLRPTIVVNSGGGLQAWWLLQEPWVFVDDPDRSDAAKHAHAWLAVVRTAAAKHGWDIDATHDLARILRVPGTFNHKTKDPRPVTLERLEERLRYSVEDFSPFVDGVAAASTPAVKEQIAAAVGAELGQLQLNPAAQPPMFKLLQLFKRDPLAELTFLHKRDPKEFTDQSASSYDFALTNYLVRDGGFTAQEIVNTLICSRAQAGAELKLRDDYYRRTVAKVTADVGRSAESAEAMEYLRTHDPKEPAVNGRRQEALSRISSLIGTRIIGITKFKMDPPEYLLRTEAGEIELGRVEGLISLGRFRAAVAATQGHLMPSMKPKDWDPVAQWLLNVCEEQDVGPDGTDRGIVDGWLLSYLEKYPAGELDETAIHSRQPFVHRDGRVCICLEHLKTFLLRKYSEQIGRKELGKLLRKCGSHDETAESRTKSGKRISRRVWVLPDLQHNDAIKGASAESSP